jgi:two-component system CheB/CheR fusion protein
MSKSAPILFIVDSDKLFREHICNLVETVGMQGLPLETAQAFLNIGPRNSPSCLLVNASLQGMGGLALQDKLKSLHCEIPLIMTTNSTGDVTTAVTAMRNGAADFFEKPLDREQFLDRIQDCILQDIKIKNSQKLNAVAAQKFSLLTPRERQVMTCCIAGMKNREMARKFGIADKTVEAHRSAVMKKMAAKSLVALADDCRRIGLGSNN